MKTLSKFLFEKQDNNYVYAVYFDDGTMSNYFSTEEEAEEEKINLETENKDNKCTIKKELLSKFENK